MLQVINPVLDTPFSGDSRAPGAQAPLVLVSPGNHIQSLPAGMWEGLQEGASKASGGRKAESRFHCGWLT